MSGTKGERTILVTGERTIDFLGLEAARVLSTPHMIGVMERTCRDSVLPLLDAGHDTVGTHIEVWHRAAAPIGAAVAFRVEVTGVNGRRIHFRMEAWNGTVMVGEGTHERAIVNVAKFASRLAAGKK